MHNGTVDSVDTCNMQMSVREQTMSLHSQRQQFGRKHVHAVHDTGAHGLLRL